MKATKKTLEKVRIDILEANIGRLDYVCNILKLQGSTECTPLIRLIQTSLMTMIDNIKEEKALTKFKL